jgi:hypothetical protein
MNSMNEKHRTHDLKQSRNPIDVLIREAHGYDNSDEFVDSLVSQIREISCQPQELEHTIGSLRSAVQRYLGNEAANGPAYRCNFCGRSRDKVDALLVSAEGSMCDDCAVLVLESISRERGQVYLRIAFFFFRVVASIGRVFHDILHRNQEKPVQPRQLRQ